jgi:PAS domain S-box-containing protein
MVYEINWSNSEMVSMREARRDANEGMETSREELRSLNDELRTLNLQLSDKVAQLEATNNDMANLLRCTDIATLFLDSSLRIRRFTPAIRQLLSLDATDVGRPIRDITLKFGDTCFVTDAEAVLAQVVPREKEVQTRDGRWWLRRTVPYRTTDDRIDGVAITFIDVSLVRHSDQRARLLAALLEDANDAVIVHDFEGRITIWNHGAERMYGYREAEAFQMNVKQLVPEELLTEALTVWKKLRNGERVAPFPTRRVSRDGRNLDIMATATPLIDEAGRPFAVAKTDWDITELTRARVRLEEEVKRRTQSLTEQQDLLRAILTSATDAIITINMHGVIQSVNPAAEQMFGFSAREMIGRNVSLIMPAPYCDQHDGFISRYLETGAGRMMGSVREVVAQHKDGTLIPVDIAISAVNRAGIFTGIIRDIRGRKQLEREIVEIATLEQQRIGQDLHDECGQELTALGLLADSLVGAVDGSPTEAVRVARKIEVGVQRVLRQVRAIARGLAQGEIEPEEFSGALSELTSRLGESSVIRCDFPRSREVRPKDALTATHLFHIAQEACTNALKHAQAKTIGVAVRTVDSSIVLEIRDDGIGMPSDACEGLGLRIMRNRARVIGAQLAIEPATPRGTVVRCILKQDQ